MSRAFSRTRPSGCGHRAVAAESLVRARPADEPDPPRPRAPAGPGQGARPRPAQAAWQTITWREGSADWLSSRYARLRVRVAHRDDQRADPRPQEWLLIEWPNSETEPTKYWLATLPNHIPFDRLVDLAQLRWRIESDYQELKQELGLAQFEGRGWRGFHHHATLCIAAYGFLISERETIPPSGSSVARIHPGACPFRSLPTPRLRRSGPNVTFRTRSPPCADASSPLSPGASTDVPAAQHKWQDTRDRGFYDAVRLEQWLAERTPTNDAAGTRRACGLRHHRS